MRPLIVRFVLVATALTLFVPARAHAAEQLCDVAYQDCRAPLLDLINSETAGIDVSFWFMQDSRYANAIIARWQAGVPVRILMDTEANAGYPGNADILKQFADAGIPMREKSGGSGILHWKFMLFVGQNQLEFSGANYSAEAFVPITPYQNYVDEVIFFTDDSNIINSFKTHYDDAWTDTTGVFTTYANIAAPTVRNYPTYPIDPEMNFVPWQDFATRSVNAYKAETQSIDAIMYRITDKRHTDQMIAAVQRGVPVRLITDPDEYREPSRLWDAYNVDVMYMNGVQVRVRGHQGLSHEKLTLLNGQQMAIFGSSNWTTASAASQHEHNIFTTSKAWFYQWAVDHFNRKWNNLGPSPESAPFTPLPPDAPVVKFPADGAAGQPLTVTLKWYGGPWSHRYDVYFGTDPSNMAKVVDDVNLGPSISSSSFQTYTVANLAESTTYYWRVIDRTMANLEKTGSTWSFRTQGSAPTAGANDVVLWAAHAATHPGWDVTSDTSAAGGSRLANANLGAAKLTAPLASPAQYFDLGFNADAGGPYRIWVRGKAYRNDYANDSVYVQLSDAVTSSGTPMWQLDTTSGTTVQIEDCSGCGLSGWGWNDNGYTSTPGALGQTFYLQNSGAHTVRVQVREDGISIDQIVISKDTFLNTAPGYAKNDGTIYVEQNATTPPSSGPTATPAAPSLPSGWADADIGSPSPAGSASYANGTYTVAGAGGDIWGSADQFHFAYVPMSGDATIVARVATVQQVADWTKAGAMIRESLAAGSAHASLFVSANKGLAFQRRTTTGGVSTNTSGPLARAPYWVKLVRSGTAIAAYYSSDGSAWTLLGSDTFAMASAVYVGIPVSSHVNGTLATATVDNVSVSAGATTTPAPPAVPSPWTAGDIGAAAPAGTAALDSSGTFTVKGSGADIWGSADAFQFVSQPLTGDGEVVARVTSLQNVNAWTKAGVMMRDTLAAGSPHASMFVSAGKGLAFQRRVTAGGLSTNMYGPAAGAPYWVKMVRLGSSFTAYVSTDGLAWTQVGTETIPMGASIDVGLAVTSHVNGTLAAATFDNVTVTKY